MAQPVFDGHPLEEYFKDSGEVSEPMPGGIPDISLQPYLTGQPSTSKHAERMERLCFLVFGAVESLVSLFSSHRASQRTKAFAERFKYGVISSSLLSPAYPATPIVESHRRGFSPSLPGRLSSGHSRTPSAAESIMTDNLSLSMPPEPETPVWPLTVSFTVVIAALSTRFYSVALLLLAATLYYMRVHRLDTHSKPDVMTPSLLALQHLIAAGRLWDTVINDTFTMLENEEQSIFYGPTSPRTPSSPLRVTLSSSLLTTQTQCDNVRQLLSAITSPSELAQLSEMYAPPSPIRPTFSCISDSHRSLSHPGSPSRATLQTDRTRKRSTWNGSYTSLALAGASPALAQRRERRRSDLSALLGNISPSPARVRLRNAPSSPSQLLTDVSEEEEGMITAESSLVGDDDENSFGTAALGLYQNRVRDGLRALELSHRSVPPSLTRGDLARRRTTMSPGSKYTSMHTTRHPTSLSSLRQSLQNALASKRFACSHLLALRFEDDEDEVYWEDVCAVMSLLTSTLADASARLAEVLEDVEERQLTLDMEVEDAPSSGVNTPSELASPPSSKRRLQLPLAHALEQAVSFAPTPTHLARFASHVDAIAAALDDARDELGRCVRALGEPRTPRSSGHSSHPSSSSCGDAGVGPGTSTNTSAGTSTGAATSAYAEPTDHPAIQAYERLRRELGLALRECERGRERLVCIVAPPTPPTSEELPVEDAEDRCDREGVGVEKRDEEQGAEEGEVSLTILSPDGERLPLAPDANPDAVDMHATDDASTHLLQATSAVHLPPPGIEQVFEADAAQAGFVRERSRLSREERIRLARAKREAVQSGTGPEEGKGGAQPERWGPSGDVVQELKDVIWQVGERRRKMAMAESQ